MKKMNKDELKKCQIGILDYIDNLCKKNGIRYWIDYGTLLGAVRHHGYIPWDDDIDVSMLREDYNKLIEVCKSNNSGKYQLSCVELDKKCMYPFGKMLDSETVLFEKGEDGITTSVYVDIFVFDNAPKDNQQRNKAFDQLDKYGHLRKYQLPFGAAPMSLKRIGALIKKGFISILPRQYYTRKIVQAAKNNSIKESSFVCDFTCPYYYSRWCVDKNIFLNTVDLSFEGKMYPAPEKYDEWLRIQYGDYMIIPSKEEQMAHLHEIEAYFK